MAVQSCRAEAAVVVCVWRGEVMTTTFFDPEAREDRRGDAMKVPWGAGTAESTVVEKEVDGEDQSRGS